MGISAVKRGLPGALPAMVERFPKQQNAGWSVLHCKDLWKTSVSFPGRLGKAEKAAQRQRPCGRGPCVGYRMGAGISLAGGFAGRVDPSRVLRRVLTLAAQKIFAKAVDKLNRIVYFAYSLKKDTIWREPYCAIFSVCAGRKVTLNLRRNLLWQTSKP